MSHGYDINHKLSFRLMQGRMGIYDSYKTSNLTSDSSLDGLADQNTRLGYRGGNLQQKRMISDKLRTLDRACRFSYQGANIRKVTETNDSDTVRALINPNKLKQDYDDKVLSVRYDYNYKPGDVFYWEDTNTYWLIYLQDLTELAYFRGDIRKCSHEINWRDKNGDLQKTFAAIRGPVETRINYIQKHGISADTPNLSLNILLPLTKETAEYFKRYTKFYLRNDPYHGDVCWRVEAINWISTPNILEIDAVEYYANETEDDIENGIVGEFITQPINPNNEAVEETIVGESFIKPKLKYNYEYTGNLDGEWRVNEDAPVYLEADGKKVTVTWTKTFSGKFDLFYGEVYKKTIKVESLF